MRAAVGAGVGAIAGGAIGSRLDAQAAELRRDLGQDVAIVNTGRELVVTMPQDILFATDSSSVRPDLQANLRAVAQNINSYPTSAVIIGSLTAGLFFGVSMAAYFRYLANKHGLPLWVHYAGGPDGSVGEAGAGRTPERR